MSTENVEVFNRYYGNGVATQFSIGFPYLKREFVKVYLYKKDTDEENVLNSDQFSFVNDGIIQYPVLPADEILKEGDILTIQRETELGSEFEFDNQRRLFPVEVMNADDLAFQQIQELSREIKRAVRVNPTATETPEELLNEVYGKLDSASEIANEAIIAAGQATVAAEQATTAVEEAQKQVIQTQEYIDEKRAEVDAIVAEAEASVDDAITQATEDVKQAALDAAQEAINGAAAQAVAIVEDYTNNEVKPELMAFVASADEDSMMASESAEKSRKWAEGSDTEVIALGGEHSSKTWSGIAKQYTTSAQGYASSSENSARIAQEAASQASQASGKIIQLGFDGAMEDGKLVFKHAPSGVEIPYELLDDYEYEVDMLYSSVDELSSDLPMVVKNGANTITFVSALHRSADEPATVGDMAPVSRKDNIGYRWLFKAAYKITPAGKHVLLLYPVAATSTTITYWE